MAKYQDRLFPKTPIIYTGMDRRTLPPDGFQKNATFVGEDFKLTDLVEDILQLAPETTNIVVVLGASPFERYWTAEFRRAFEPFTHRVSFTWVNDLSFILLALLIRDTAGVTHNENDALQRLHAVANAPINGLYQHRARARGPPRAQNNLGGGATFHIVLPAFLGEETMVRQRPV